MEERKNKMSSLESAELIQVAISCIVIAAIFLIASFFDYYFQSKF